SNGYDTKGDNKNGVYKTLHKNATSSICNHATYTIKIINLNHLIFPTLLDSLSLWFIFHPLLSHSYFKSEPTPSIFLKKLSL
ncbi:hypothetical protein ACO1Z0_23295, partial [Escherichia coli]|uniref:hypothetical protein n=1 Tax=Escherichia coli TaxID=562 RepID=UPI003BF69724